MPCSPWTSRLHRKRKKIAKVRGRIGDDPRVPDSPSPKAFKRIVRNLTALDRVNPALGERIRLPVEDDHVLNSWGNRPERKLGRGSMPLAQSLLDYKIPLAVEGEGILLFGVGLGEGVSALLKRFPDKPIIAW